MDFTFIFVGISENLNFDFSYERMRKEFLFIASCMLVNG